MRAYCDNTHVLSVINSYSSIN